MNIAIIGAGYSGLTIAKKLEKKGNNVTIFEKNNSVGGMVSTVDLYDTKLEKYYRHIFKSDKEAIELIKKNSRKYAKRQYTFFKNQFDIKWFNVDFNNFNNTINEVLEYSTTIVNNALQKEM